MNDDANVPFAVAQLQNTEQLGAEREVQVLDSTVAPFVSKDAFMHLPHLRGRLIPADKSAMRITRKALGIYDELACKAGYPLNWRHSDQKIEATWRAFFSDWENPSDLWVFAYGSLMWDPGFRFAEVRLASVEGYQRRFTLKTEIARGSPGRPALMLALERQPGRCRGLVFRIAADVAEAESEILWRREMIAGGYCPTIVSMTTPQGSIRGLAFTSNTSHPRYAAELPLRETAAIIATGTGAIGTNRAYLEETAAQLEALEIADPYVEQLLKEVSSFAVA
jgi:glutathione-specific gamma-glutamylcyclotransferase